jgi:ribonucleoside-diphosphate reductase alpha chain
MVDHPNIKSATSIVDFIFRALAYEYLGRTDLVHVLDKPEVMNTGSDDWDEIPTNLEYEKKTPVMSDLRPVSSMRSIQTESKMSTTLVREVKSETSSFDAVNAAAKSMQSDAPACNVCGHITIRSGTCYKCLNCGNSMGCS